MAEREGLPDQFAPIRQFPSKNNAIRRVADYVDDYTVDYCSDQRSQNRAAVSGGQQLLGSASWEFDTELMQCCRSAPKERNGVAAVRSKSQRIELPNPDWTVGRREGLTPIGAGASPSAPACGRSREISLSKRAGFYSKKQIVRSSAEGPKYGRTEGLLFRMPRDAASYFQNGGTTV